MPALPTETTTGGAKKKARADDGAPKDISALKSEVAAFAAQVRDDAGGRIMHEVCVGALPWNPPVLAGEIPSSPFPSHTRVPPPPSLCCWAWPAAAWPAMVLTT